MIRVEEISSKYKLIFENGKQNFAIIMDKLAAESWKLLFDEVLENGIPFDQVYHQAEIVFRINQMLQTA